MSGQGYTQVRVTPTSSTSYDFDAKTRWSIQGELFGVCSNLDPEAEFNLIHFNMGIGTLLIQVPTVAITEVPELVGA